MVIRVTGTRYIKYKNKANQEVDGYEVHGLIINSDEEDKNVIGYLTFNNFFSNQNLGFVPMIDTDYEVVFTMRKFNGGYQAYPHHLCEV